MNVIWHNGALLPDQPVFTASDRLRLGDGVFDTMLAVDGRLSNAAAHFSRLARHAESLKIPLNFTGVQLGAAAQSLLRDNVHTHGRFVVHTILSRGSAAPGLAIPENAAPHLVMRSSAAPKETPELHAVISETVKRNEHSPLSRIKSCNYGDNILALAEAQAKGSNEAIIFNTSGHLACASVGNVFIEDDGQLFTPALSDGVIDGTVRAAIIARYKAVETSLTRADLENADAVYITSSIRGAVPLASLNGKKLSSPSLKIDKDFHLF